MHTVWTEVNGDGVLLKVLKIADATEKATHRGTIDIPKAPVIVEIEVKWSATANQ